MQDGAGVGTPLGYLIHNFTGVASENDCELNGDFTTSIRMGRAAMRHLSFATSVRLGLIILFAGKVLAVMSIERSLCCSHIIFVDKNPHTSPTGERGGIFNELQGTQKSHRAFLVGRRCAPQSQLRRHVSHVPLSLKVFNTRELKCLY